MNAIVSFPYATAVALFFLGLGVVRGEPSEPLVELDFRTEIPIETSGKNKVGIEVFKKGNTEPEFVSGVEGAPGMLSFAPTSWLGGGLLMPGVEGPAALSESDDEITVAAWVKPAASAVEGKQSVVGNLNEKESSGWIFGIYPDGSVLFFWSRPEALATIRKTATLCNEGEWHHIVVVWKNNDEQGVDFYVDGLPVEPLSGDGRVVRSKGTTPIPLGEAPLTIGTTASGRFPFSGGIRSIKLFDRALDSEEIFRLSQAGVPSE